MSQTPIQNPYPYYRTVTAQQIAHGLADVFARLSQPSPARVALAVEQGLLALGQGTNPEVAPIQAATQKTLNAYGDWAGGRVEPREVADYLLSRL